MSYLITKVGLLALLPLMVIFEWSLPPTAPIDRANFARIKEGMTTKEVEKILGRPIAGYTQGGELHNDTLSVHHIWDGRNCAIVVYFANDRVWHKSFFQPTLWERIDDWMNERQRMPDGSRVTRLKEAT